MQREIMVVVHLVLRTTTTWLSMLNSLLLCKLEETKVWERCMVGMGSRLTRLEVVRVLDMVHHLASVHPRLGTRLPRPPSMRQRVQALSHRHLLDEEAEAQAIRLLLRGLTLHHRLSRLLVQVIHRHRLPSLLLRRLSLHQVQDSAHPHLPSHLHHLDSHRAVQHSHLLHRDSHPLHLRTRLLRLSTVRLHRSTRLLPLSIRLQVRSIALLARSIVLLALSIARLALNTVPRARRCPRLLRLMRRKSRLPMEHPDTHLVRLVSYDSSL